MDLGSSEASSEAAFLRGDKFLLSVRPRDFPVMVFVPPLSHSITADAIIARSTAWCGVATCLRRRRQRAAAPRG